jgi:hypothetical protein
MPYKNVKTAEGEDVVPGKVKGTDIVRSTPEDPMEPIADEAMETIGQAKALIIRLLEVLDNCGIPESAKIELRNGLKSLRAYYESLQHNVEDLMEIGEPKTPCPSGTPNDVCAMVQQIQQCGHEARIFVIDICAPAEHIPTTSLRSVVGYTLAEDIPGDIRPLDHLRAVDDNAVRLRVPVRGFFNPLLFFHAPFLILDILGFVRPPR